MHYDSFGRSPAATPAPTAPTAPTAPPAPTAAVPPRAELALLRAYLEAHCTVWHTESLRALYPEIVAYLDSRYVAARDHVGLVVRCLDGTHPELAFGTDDLRPVAEALLSREYRKALFDERISPSIERLSA